MGSAVGALGAGRRRSWTTRVILFCLGPCLGLVAFGLGVTLLTPAAFHWAFVSEFGPVELGTAASFGAAAILAFGLAARSRGVVPVGFRALYLLFALGALFAGLEEISYGQHFFGWQTPRWFAEQNAQHETNLHNLLGDKPGKALRNVALVAVAVGGIGLPAAAMWAGGQFAPGRWPNYLLPRGELIPLVAVTFLMRLVRTLPRQMRAGWDVGLYEMMELYLAITALGYIVVLRRRLVGRRLRKPGCLSGPDHPPPRAGE
jgi:hypothetical protein